MVSVCWPVARTTRCPVSFGKAVRLVAESVPQDEPHEIEADEDWSAVPAAPVITPTAPEEVW